MNPPPFALRSERSAAFLLYTTATLVLVLFTLLAWQIHATFNTTAYDLGLFDQAFWRYSQFLPNFNTVRGMGVMGDHFTPMSVIFAPLYWIWPSIGWGFLLQSLSVALGGILLSVLTRHYFPQRPWLGLGMACAYWLHPAVHNILLWQYHEIALASGLYFVLIWAYLKDRWPLFLGTVLLLLTCREDMPFTLVGVGFIALLDRRWRYAGWTIALSVIWWIVVTRYAMGWFNDGVGYFRASHGSLSILAANFHNPAFYLEKISDPQALTYLRQVALPAGVLAVLAPRYLIPAIPTLIANVLIGAYNTRLEFHYSVNVMPFVFWGCLAGLQRLSLLRDGPRWQAGIPALAIALLLAGSCWIAREASKMPLSELPTKYQDWKNAEPRRKFMAELRAKIGSDGVAASDWLVPHLAHREGIYIFPNPWIPHYWHVSGQHPHHPNAVNYVILNSDRIADQRDLYDYLVDSGTFKQIASEHGIVVLRREKPEAADRDEAIRNFRRFSPLPTPPFTRISVSPSFATPETEFRRLDISLRAIQRQAPASSHAVDSPPADTPLEIDLGSFAEAGDFRTRYVRAELQSPGQCEAKLLLGSDDGLTVWLNGNLVHENIVLRQANLGDDTLALALRPGRNVLVFRVNNAGGAWLFKALLRMRKCDGAK